MLKQPIYYEFNLDARTSPSKLIAISHVDDKYSEVLEVAVKQNDRFVYMGGATVIARMVLHRDKDYLLSDDVACSVNDNGNILIPFDNAVVKTSQGVVKIEVNITRDADELTFQFPLWVSVNGSILDNAEVTPESEGTIPDLLKDAADALEDATEALDRLGSYNNLEDKPQINGVTLSGDKTLDKFGVAGWKIAAIDNCIEDGVLYSTQINNQAAYVLARNITTDITQYAFCRDGRVMWRTRQAETQWQPAGEWSEWEEIGSKIASGVVNQNGTITFFDENGDPLFTTTGESVIGADGYSPTVSTTNLDAQTLVTVTDTNGAHNFYVKDGSSVTNAAVDENGDLIISIQQKPTSSVHPTIHTLDVNAGHVVGAAGADGYSPTVSTTNLDAQTLVTVTDTNGAHNFYVKDGSSVTNAAVDENGDLIISIQQKPTSSVHPTIHTLDVNAGHVVGAKGDKGDKGDTGNDYVLTPQDKTDIAGMVDISGKADKATTLAGYGITDAYTKTQTDTFFLDTNADIADLKAYIGYTDGDILGLHADFENKVFTRLGAAVGLTAGQDFNAFTMYGGRRRCCVSNDGTINAYYGEQDYVEDGSNGQVMVYQPKFYYCMVPLKLEKQASGLGYHIRKANYYVTANPHPGFKLHPLFYDANGNEVDYVLLSAYEGSMYDVSESAYVNDGVDSISYASGDLLCSVSGKKPISGKLTSIGTRKNFEDMAQTRGTSWHLDTIQSVSANQLLMMIELGTLNVQSAVGRGVVTASDNGKYNCASLTGATASLGNATGMASTTIGESAGTETTETTNGKLSVSYRGVENPWGNIWKYINGINLWGNGSMNGGQAYICSDFTFSDSDRTQHYQPSGFTVSNSNGYASAFGYGDEAYDWLMIPSECTGSSIEPVGDQSYFKPDLNEFNIARLGGSWNSNTNGGAYCWGFLYASGFRYYFLGGRLLYVPTATGFGPQGPAGSNYVLTAADRQTIAQIAMDGLNGNGVAY